MLQERSYPKKRFGQSFLIDRNIIDKIVDVSGVSKDDIVLEIGPGRGVLTKELAKRAKKVLGIELDKVLFSDLKDELCGLNNVMLVNDDILLFDIKEFIKNSSIKEGVKIVANIPYSITTPILEFIFDNIDCFSDIFLMVQKEYALRLIAKDNTENYSSLTCFTQFYTIPKVSFMVKKTCFRPIPKVDSTFINLKPRIIDEKVRDRKLLFKVINTAFNQRRKSIDNSLSTILEKKKLSMLFEDLKINSDLRAENISLDTYIDLTNSIIDYLDH